MFAKGDFVLPYTDRIPVESTYAEALGYVSYNFATTAWMIVYLGSLIAPSFVSKETGVDFATVARDFSILSDTGKFPEFGAIAARFSQATARRQELEKAIPITAYGGVQELNGSDNTTNHPWPQEDVVAFAKELEALDIDANALYYKLKETSAQST